MGIFVARELRDRVKDVDVVTTSMIGLNLLDIMAGYDIMFVIDAFVGDAHDVGQLRKSLVGEGSLHLFSSHGMDFHELLSLGKELGYEVPEVAAIYGIGIDQEVPFGEELSARLAEKLPSIVERIARDIMTCCIGSFS